MNHFKKVLALAVALVLTISMVPATNVDAAAKASLNKKKATIYVGKTVQLKVKNNKKKVKWSTSNKKVATVSKKGKVKGKKAGKATITAKVGSKKYKCKITVKKKKVKNNNNTNNNNTNTNINTTPGNTNNGSRPIVVTKSTKEKIAEACMTYGTSNYSDSLGTYYYLSDIYNTGETYTYTQVMYSVTYDKIRVNTLFGDSIDDLDYMTYFEIVSESASTYDTVFYWNSQSLFGEGTLYKYLMTSENAIVYTTTNMASSVSESAAKLATAVTKLTLRRFNEIMSKCGSDVTYADLGFSM